MDGSATLTMKKSSTTMNAPASSTGSAAHGLRPACDAAAGARSATVLVEVGESLMPATVAAVARPDNDL